MTRRVEIAGAGFAGLVAAIAFAKKGWSVGVHERSSGPRLEGFAIGVHDNALRVLQAVDVLERVLHEGRRISLQARYDKAGRQVFAIVPAHRSYRLPRSSVLRALTERAESLGVTISYDSMIVSADPAGALIRSDGRKFDCDLAVAADGIRSAIRPKLPIRTKRITLRDGAMRIMLPASDDVTDRDDPDGNVSYEYWSGSRRVVSQRCSSDETYVVLCGRNSDDLARRIPFDAASWKQAFPHLESLLERVRNNANWDSVLWTPFELIRLSRWSAGRVAIVGDAATAMPPNLGQGGGLAMTNALSLASYFDEPSSIEDCLTLWEARERGLTDHTQTWSRFYSSLGSVPDLPRSIIMTALGRIPWVRAQYQRASRHIPTGAS